MSLVRWIRVALFGVLFAVAACGGGGSSGPSKEQVTGSWTASKVLYTSTASPRATFDVVASGGSATLDLATDGTWRFVVTPAGKPSETTLGKWQMDGDVMTVTPTGMPFSLQFNATLSGNTLTLGGADSEFDFNGDDIDEAAKLDLELHR